MTTVTARAHTNIALIKYWGKKDKNLIIPYNDSISMTLDRFYSQTSVCFDETLKSDVISLDQKTVDAKTYQQITSFLDLIRQKAAIKTFATVASINHVPTAAGLASSASGFAALAAAASKAAGLSLTNQELSRLARRGSGSACRSVYGGFVHWQGGHDDLSSFATPIEETVNWDIEMIAVVINHQQKNISSRLAMQQTVETSPYYQNWVTDATAMIEPMKTAILKHNFQQVGQLAELSAMRMHATTFSANPAYTYFQPETLEVIQLVQDLRQAGIQCYYTMDAGPNVKIICQKQNETAILQKLQTKFKPDQLLIATPGPGITYL